MRKEELIKLAKELSELEDLKGREQDLFFLKREYIRLNDREEETFFEKKMTEEFNVYFEKLASRVSDLTKSSLEDKKAIIEKAKAMLASDANIKGLNKALNELFNDFKQLPRCSKEQDDELFTEFKSIREQATNKVNAYYEQLRNSLEEKKTKKEQLIKDAREALKMENMKDATAKMDAIFNEWKKVGFAGKEIDNALWEEFQEVRKEFSQIRKAHFENMKVVYEERASKKEALIKKIKYITSEAYFTDEEMKQLRDIESEFRKIGFAGKEKDQELWDNMQAAIKKYYEEMKFYK